MNDKNTKFNHILYIVFVVFYIWLAAQIPYTHDDWDWGLEIGMQQWLTASVNSRYVGNFFEIIMTRSPILKTVIMGSAFFTLPWLLSRIATKRNKDAQPLLFLAANFLILTMSRFIWSETYGWVAGFANFGLSSIFTLLLLTQWLPLCEEEYTIGKCKAAFNALWFIVALCGQLFIENLSIVMVGVAFLACILSYIRAKQIPSHFISICFGCFIGLVIMFSSSVYDSLLGSGEAVGGYRQLIVSTENGLKSLIFRIFVQAARLITRAGEANYVLCVSVLIVLTCKLIKYSDWLKKPLILLNLCFFVYFTVNFILQTDYTADKLMLSAFAALVNGLYFLLVPVEAFFLYKSQPAMHRKLIFIWFLGISLLLPLVVTSEAGYRLVFSLNIMATLFVLIILQDIFEGCLRTKELYFTLSAVCFVPIFVCIVVYSAIGRCTDARMNIIDEASESKQTEIHLPAYPYEQYLHAPDPIDELRMGFFKEFYGINENVSVIIETTD